MSTLDNNETINNNLGTISNSFSSITKEKSYLSKHYDDLFKLVIIGDSGVGKSCILLRFADDTFTENYYSTIGVDFRFKCVDIGERKCKLQIWDTAGQERFKTVTSAYYRGADGIIIVFDQTDRESFNNVQHWIDDISKYSTEEPSKIIIANKEDISDERKSVKMEDIAELEKKTGLEVIKTSAKTGENIDYAFKKLTQKLLIERNNRILSKGYSLEPPVPVEGRFAPKKSCMSCMDT
jgi:Ras-related protein Rab-1A